MKSKTNFYFSAGMLIFALSLLCKHLFAGYPHFLHGLFMGLSLVFMLIGAKYSAKTMAKWRIAKTNVIKRLVKNR
ncbi:MAG: hypothetical protein FWG22_02360 [Prolixibacteraceae bacterium]|nr:hypothetical protein [Prolixibacteraceae bacterium]